MKKLLISLFMIFSLILSTVIAGPPTPAPVKILVSVNGVGINYEDTKVTNKFTGEEYFISEGDFVEVDGKVVTVVNIGESSVLIDVAGGSDIISEGEDKQINGLIVLVDHILYNDQNRYVELVY